MITYIFGKFITLLVRKNRLRLSNQKSFRIVYYHRVPNYGKSYYFENEKISLTAFRKQIRFYKSNFNVIPLSEALKRAIEGLSLENYLSISFDDGFIENYTEIAPILVDEKVSATFFLIWNCIGNKDLMWRNKLMTVESHLGREDASRIMLRMSKLWNINAPQAKESLLSWSLGWEMSKKDHYANMIWKEAKLEFLPDWLEKHKPYMTRVQIRELIDSGFEIGSHTLSHPICNKLDYGDLSNEIYKSIELLNDLFDTQVQSVSYPFGIRPNIENELRLLGNGSLISLLGINNVLKNFSQPGDWDRDLMEMGYEKSLVKFIIYPVVKKYLSRVWK